MNEINPRPFTVADFTGVAALSIAAALTTAPPQTQGIIWRYPEPATGLPNDFAARGAHELALHTHDICACTDVALDPPPDIGRRLVDQTADWPLGTLVRTDDPWSDLLARSGRVRV